MFGVLMDHITDQFMTVPADPLHFALDQKSCIYSDSHGFNKAFQRLDLIVCTFT
jgi:hypothetical protein